MSGGAAGGGGDPLSLHAPCQAAGVWVGCGASGGFSTRNAVVSCPARTCGCATSQRRKRRFVVTPSIVGIRQRRRELRERILSRRPVGDELRDQRVVAKADLVAFFDSRVDTHPRRQLEA